MSEQKAPVNKNVLLPLLLFLSFPLEEQCVGDRDEEGNLGFALYFPGWMFSGGRAVLGKGWRCSPGACQGWGVLGISQNCRDLCEDSNKHTAHQQRIHEK